MKKLIAILVAGVVAGVAAWAFDLADARARFYDAYLSFGPQDDAATTLSELRTLNANLGVAAACVERDYNATEIESLMASKNQKIQARMDCLFVQLDQFGGLSPLRMQWLEYKNRSDVMGVINAPLTLDARCSEAPSALLSGISSNSLTSLACASDQALTER